MKKPPHEPFLRRHRLIIYVLTAVVLAGLASVCLGFWSYTGPIAYASRIIHMGMFTARYEGNWNSGWDDVTANFVADYVGSKYKGSGRTDVGYKSNHALPDTTVKAYGQTTTYSLKANIEHQYTSMQPGFDPLICSTQAPSSVRYVKNNFNPPNQATTIAAFSYADGSPTNLVQYQLELILDGSQLGNWKITGIRCLSLDAQPTKPYVSQFDSSTGYSQRNDRSF